MPDQRNRRRDMAERLGEWWCGLMHNTPMWPIRGSYRCRTCGLSYPVPWDGVWANKRERDVLNSNEEFLRAGSRFRPEWF